MNRFRSDPEFREGVEAAINWDLAHFASDGDDRGSQGFEARRSAYRSALESVGCPFDESEQAVTNRRGQTARVVGRVLLPRYGFSLTNPASEANSPYWLRLMTAHPRPRETPTSSMSASNKLKYGLLNRSARRAWFDTIRAGARAQIERLESSIAAAIEVAANPPTVGIRDVVAHISDQG